MKIDYKKMAKTMYNEIISEEDKGIIAFGMMPKTVIDVFQTQLKKHLVKIYGQQYGFELEPEAVKEFEECINPELINEITHNLTIAIFHEANAQGKMVC